ncbi:Small GTPase superfamily [Kalmanozyma brasiliensis GHG001]|uniref:Small GTPase superfamily n=1 Tax=Kalmanozyma brasiliensis (strain GHG001) TaxID=1365824 RepID=UPI001CE95952|nr:Small GTPase superfamily [Kalmanozyma brasiliensis GHG001]EST08040.2 Small GTPase superfamily [Kalmanozyma brasiliensis GHG001]
MPSKIATRGDRRSPSTTPTRHPPAPHSTTSRSAILRRLHSNHETTSTLQSSAIAAMSTLAPSAIGPSSPATSLHALTPNRAIKVVLIGDTGSGKTSLRHRFLTNQFFPSYRATIGADFITRTLPVDPLNPDGEKATLQIWDTAGQERFQSLGSAFYRGADAVVVAFDASSEGGKERVRDWVKVFLDKGDGLGEEEKGSFCWICAANKVDLADVDREAVWEVLDSCVARGVGQADVGLGGEGAGEPADPGEVLSRPDPNGTDSTPSGEAADTSPTPASKDANDPAPNGGTVKTLYATPFNTLSQAPQLSSSPTAASSKQDSGSGFLSSWRRKSKPQPSQAGRGHAKRQSIRSIEVFQSDSEESDSGTEGRSRGFAFPSSSKSRTGGMQDTPPRSVQSGSKGGERRRMDSTLSTNAPSVYHTPRGSTVLSASPSLTSTLAGESSSTHLAAEDQPKQSSSAHLTPSRTPTADSKRTSMASSTLTIRPPKSINDLFNPSSAAPASPSSPAAPHAPPTPTSTLPPRTPSTISIPVEPAPPPTTGATAHGLEQGFTLFETSARTGQNVDRLFAHIVSRVVAHQAWQVAQLTEQETHEERNERERREEEVMRRTIRLASGKGNERWFGCC